MSSQRFEGKNLEEALQSAASTFAVERYQLSYHVVLEKRGFLGGMKRIVIEAEPAETTVDAPPPPRAAEGQSAGYPARRPRSGGQGGRDRGPRDRGEPRGGDRGGERGARRERPRARSRSGNDRGNEREVEQPILIDDTPAPPQEAESEAAIQVREWCEKLFSISNLEVEIWTSENDEAVTVRLYGHDTGRFITRDGELLDSVQVIANKSLVGRAIEKKIELDCRDFKGQRVESLGQKALQLADRVRSDGREQLLPAMSPVERRIVHLALEKDPEITTESRGDGFFKRVAIIRRREPLSNMES